MKNIFWFIIGGVLSIIIMQLLPKHPTQHYIIDTDTITITDTFTEYYPTPVEVVRLRDSLIYLTDTQYIFLPIEKKRYKTDNYDLTISGYNPTLESITVFPTTKHIYQTATINEKKKISFSHGIQGAVGYGLFTQKIDVWLGYGFQFSF